MRKVINVFFFFVFQEKFFLSEGELGFFFLDLMWWRIMCFPFSAVLYFYGIVGSNANSLS